MQVQLKRDTKTITETLEKLLVLEKGLICLDESDETMTVSLSSMGVESSSVNIKCFRDLVLLTPGLEQFVSAVCVTAETASGTTSTGVRIPEYLASRGICPGVRLDTGLRSFPALGGELYTTGFDTLSKQVPYFFGLGFRFAKYRCVFRVGEGHPSSPVVEDSCMGLTKFALICQETGMVPILCPEVLIEGTSSIEQVENVNRRVLSTLVNYLNESNVSMEEVIIMPSFVTPGSSSPSFTKVTPREVGSMTSRLLSSTIPCIIPGILLNSGALAEDRSSAFLSETVRGYTSSVRPQSCSLVGNNGNSVGHPWFISFGYGRALTYGAMKCWGGKSTGVGAGQKCLIDRLRQLKSATTGKYESSGDKCIADVSGVPSHMC